MSDTGSAKEFFFMELGRNMFWYYEVERAFNLLNDFKLFAENNTPRECGKLLFDIYDEYKKGYLIDLIDTLDLSKKAEHDFYDQATQDLCACIFWYLANEAREQLENIGIEASEPQWTKYSGGDAIIFDTSAAELPAIYTRILQAAKQDKAGEQLLSPSTIETLKFMLDCEINIISASIRTSAECKSKSKVIKQLEKLQAALKNLYSEKGE